jgi:hypothetical protein
MPLQNLRTKLTASLLTIAKHQRHNLGWSYARIARDAGVCTPTAVSWLNPERAAQERERKRRCRAKAMRLDAKAVHRADKVRADHYRRRHGRRIALKYRLKKEGLLAQALSQGGNVEQARQLEFCTDSSEWQVTNY